MQQMTDTFNFAGMQRDLKASAHPSTFLYDAHNIKLSQREGSTLLAIVNEQGTSDTGISILGTCLGHCLLNQYLIVFSKGEKDYIQRIDLENMQSFKIFEGNLNFSLEYPIQAIGSFECTTIQKVYWTDNYNQPRLINIAPKIGETSIVQSFGSSVYTMYDFVPTLQLREEVRIRKFQDTTGVFPAGVIQYAFTYYKQYLQESNIFYTSPLLYISPKDRGGAADERCGNAFSITIDNVDINYDYLRIYSIIRTSLNGTPVVKRVADLKVSSAVEGTLTFIDTNNTGDLIDPSELLLKNTDKVKVGCIEQKDNTLFVGNVTVLRNLLPDLSLGRATAVGTSTRSIKADSANTAARYTYSNQLNASESSEDGEYYTTQCSGFKKGDYYRVGVQFQHNTGYWSDPVFIRDCRIKTSPSTNESENIISLPSIDVLVPYEMISKVVEEGYLRARPVVVFPDYQDRVTVCQGIANTTISSDNLLNSSSIVWSSWFFRPLYNHKSVPQDVDHPQVLDGGITPSYYDENFLHIPHLLKTSSDYKSEAPSSAESAREQDMLRNFPNYFRGVEYDGSYTTQYLLKQKSDMVTLHTPEIEFDEQLLMWDYNGFMIKRVGDVFCKSTMYDLTVQTSSSTIGEATTGYGTRITDVKNKSFGLVAGYFYEDKSVDDMGNAQYLPMANDTGQHWLVMPWQRDGALNNDVNRDGASNVLKSKILSNLRFMDTLYSDDYSEDTISNTAISVFDSISKDIVKVGDINYYGNVDYALASDKEDGRYFRYGSSNSVGKTWREDNWDGRDIYKMESSNNGYWSKRTSYWGGDLGDHTREAAMTSPLVKITYKSTPHIVFKAPSNNLFTRLPVNSGGECTLPLLSIERQVTDDFIDSLFGGTSRKALENNVWLPCGDSVYIKPTGADSHGQDYHYNYISFPTLIGDLDSRLQSGVVANLSPEQQSEYQDCTTQIVEELPEDSVYIYAVARYDDLGTQSFACIYDDSDWESLVEALYMGEISNLTLSIEAHKGKPYAEGGIDVEYPITEITPREWQRYAKKAGHIAIDTSEEHTEGVDRYWNVEVLGLSGKLYINKKTYSISLNVQYAQYQGFRDLNRWLYGDTFIMQEVVQDCINVRIYAEYKSNGTTVREEIVPVGDASNYDYSTHHYTKVQIIAEDINGNRLWLSADEWEKYCEYLASKWEENYFLYVDKSSSTQYGYNGYLYYNVEGHVNTMTVGEVKSLPYPYIEFNDIEEHGVPSLSVVQWDVVKIKRSDYLLESHHDSSYMETKYLTYRCFVKEDYAGMPYKALLGIDTRSCDITLNPSKETEKEYSAHNVDKNGHWVGITPKINLQGTQFTLLTIPYQTAKFGIRIKKEKLENSTQWYYQYRYILGCISGARKWYSWVNNIISPIKDSVYSELNDNVLVKSTYENPTGEYVSKNEMIEDGEYYYFEISLIINSASIEEGVSSIDNEVYGCAMFDFRSSQNQVLPDSIEILNNVTMSFVKKVEKTIPGDDGKDIHVYSGDVVLPCKYGDTYFQRYDHLKTYAYTEDDKNQVVEIGSFMVETRMNIDGRYDKNRGQQSNIYTSPKNFNLFNPVYSQTNNFFTYRIKPESFYKNLETPNEVAWSLEKSASAETDVWSDITYASSMEMDGSKGRVVDIKSFKDNIFCFQDRGISQIMFNSRVQIPTSDGVPIEIANSQKVDSYRIVQDGIGISDKKHLQRTPNGLYFIDSVTNELHVFNGAELQNISQTRNMSSWFKDTSIKQLLYDNYRHDLYIDNAINPDECLSFSESLGQFTSFMSYGGTHFMETFDKRSFTAQGNKLWEMYSGDYNNFFDSYKDWDITFISNGIDNKIPGADKIYSTIGYTLDLYDSGVYNTDKHFNYARLWNEYQDTRDFALSQKSNNSIGRSKYYAHDNSQKKFRIWRVQIPRAAKFSDGVWKAGLDRIRNPWCYVKLGRKSSETQDTLKAVLQDIGVQYFT